MKRLPPYRDGALHVVAERCSTCMFRTGNLMHLQEGRLADLVKSNLDAKAALVCHQTLEYGDRPDVGEALCRGFVDSYGDRVPAVRLATALGITCQVEMPT